MDSLIVNIIVAVGSFWVGWHIRGIVILANLASQPEKMIGILEQIQAINQNGGTESDAEQLTGDELRIERVGNTLYAYSKVDDEFISQGPDLVTLLDAAHKRFPSRSFFGTIESTDPAKELAGSN
jgi:hypothetical protein